MKLKTLKEIRMFLSSPKVPVMIQDAERECRWYSEHDLKQEAIKHIKYKKPKLYGKPIIKPKFTAEQVDEAIEVWIKWFFDITEEDLK